MGLRGVSGPRHVGSSPSSRSTARARGAPTLRDAAGQAAAALAANRLRSALGALAIAAAVATMALVVTALDGLGAYARANAARAFGSDTFVIAQIASPGRVSRRELERKLARNPVVRRSDLRFLERHAAGRVIYAPSAQRPGDVIAGARRYEFAAVTGTGADLADIRELGIVEGRFFRRDEEVRAAQVAVLGHDVAATLFPGTSALGRTIRLAGRGFAVIGVQGPLGTSGGASLDRYVWIPLQAFERAFGPPASLQIFARAVEADLTLEAEDHARATMRARRRLGPGVEDTFDVLSPDAARSFVLALSERIGIAALPISIMALLAAIVVVTNTVLVSVSQRTREIGVRRAVGASRRQIVREVLAESTLVALAGGLVGLAVVWALVEVAARASGVALAMAPATAAWSLAAATTSGLLAGWYPARRAVRVDVIDAIRVE
jgi:putative ABC transport system permease protein